MLLLLFVSHTIFTAIRLVIILDTHGNGYRRAERPECDFDLRRGVKFFVFFFRTGQISDGSTTAGDILLEMNSRTRVG